MAYLRADEALRYGKVIEVVDKMKHAGVEQIGFVYVLPAEKGRAVNDAVDRLIVEREAMDRGLPGGVVLSISAHAFLVAGVFLAALLGPKEPLLKVQDRIRGGPAPRRRRLTHRAGAGGPTARSAKTGSNPASQARAAVQDREASEGRAEEGATGARREEREDQGQARSDPGLHFDRRDWSIERGPGPFFRAPPDPGLPAART